MVLGLDDTVESTINADKKKQGVVISVDRSKVPILYTISWFGDDIGRTEYEKKHLKEVKSEESRERKARLMLERRVVTRRETYTPQINSAARNIAAADWNSAASINEDALNYQVRFKRVEFALLLMS